MATDQPAAGVFAAVTPRVDFVALEQEQLRWWDKAGIVGRYLRRNEAAARRYSFIDGPITANNPMGVHHAWGRTYKDLFLRWRTMQGYRQRYQNGFDGQGLWVEVEVEKQKGFSSKRDIEAYGIARFVEDCKQRVRKYAAIQTRQSQRLGYWMDWDDSYHTMSDENNYTIWHFLKRCHEKGWLYRGTDSMPWCARCGTGLSQHEIVTEGYQEVTHTAVYVRLPLTDLKGRAESESLLIWTTTPWTLTANVAAAVHPEHRYVRARVGDEILYLGKERIGLLTEMAGALEGRPGDKELANPLEQLGVSDLLGVSSAGEVLGVDVEVLEELPGSALVGRAYRGPLRRPGGAGRGRASRHPLERSGRGRGHRDRAHRPRCRSRGLRPGQGARPGGGRPPRRERPLRGRLRLASREKACSTCATASSPTWRARGCCTAPRSTSTATPSAGAATASWCSGWSTSGSSPWTSCATP